MADWGYVPDLDGLRLVAGERRMLVTRYGDGTEHRRETSTAAPREWIETYTLSSTDADSLVDFWETYRAYTAFSRLTYDPSEASNATANARFVSCPLLTPAGPSNWVVETHMIEVL